jgi:photosystem II stability/assembly factor-like uncharacterized protein
VSKKFLLFLFFIGNTVFSQSWVLLNTGLPANIKVHSVVFTQQSNYQVGYAVGGDNYTSGIVIKTTDGGETWSAMQTIASEELYSVSFPTNDTGYTCSMEGKIYKTTNGGTFWQLIYTVPSSQAFAISFKDANHGVLGTPGSIMFTSNGGLLWQSGSGSSNTNSQDISWCEGSTYLATGYTHTNISTDDGQTWSSQPVSGLSLGAGSYGAKYLTTCGDYGNIRVSKDYGATWLNHNNVGDLNHDAAYWDTNYIYVVGTPGIALKSSNGGQSFTSAGSLGSGAVFCVFITPAFTVYATGSQGKIWRKQEAYPYPAILVTPDTLQFDTINAGSSQAKSLTVTNTGSQDLVISDISSSLPEYSANPTSFTVTPGQSKTVDVTFTPTTEGSYPSILSVYSNAPGQSITNIILKGYANFPVGMTIITQDKDFIQCYPNPFGETLNIKIHLETAQMISLQLFDASGKLAASCDKMIPAGTHEYEIHSLLPSSGIMDKGVYYLKIVTGNTIMTKKIIRI